MYLFFFFLKSTVSQFQPEAVICHFARVCQKCEDSAVSAFLFLQLILFLFLRSQGFNTPSEQKRNKKHKHKFEMEI